MKNVIIHIGQPKTGSTSLQYFLLDNKCFLESKKVGYFVPEDRFNPWFTYSNGGLIVAEMLNRLKDPKDYYKNQFMIDNPSLDIFRIRLKEKEAESIKLIKKNLEVLKNYCRRYDTLIFSEELFWHYEIFYDNFFETLDQLIREIVDDECEIDIVIYLRRQDKWIVSKWKEDMRNEIPSSLGFYETLKAYESLNYLDYYSCLKRIEKVFGKNHTIVRTYDSDFLFCKDVRYDFLFSNKKILFSELLKKKSRSFNPSISVETALAMVLINKGIVNYTNRDRRFYEATRRFEHLLPNDSIKANILDENEVRELLDRYSDCNRKIEEEFLDGKALFNYEVKEEMVIKPDIERDLNNAYQISMIVKNDSGS